MASIIEDPAPAIRLNGPAGRWVLLATVLGSSMAFLDATVVNVALPTIGRQFGASLGGLQWTVTAYTLTLAGLILLGGALGDRLGRRRVFMVGVGWFALASALCGLAPSIGVLIAARTLQGIGGALLTPGSLAIIQAAFAAEDRPRAVGAWSGLGGVAGAVGPLLGGWIVQTAGWRWVFLLNLPLAVLVIAVAARHVPETSDPSAQGRFDVAGAVLAALALAGITYALIEATSGGGPAGPVTAAVIGLAAAVVFVRVERHRSRAPDRVPPMLPLDVFASRQFTSVNVVTFLVYGAFSGVIFLLVLQLQLVAGFSPLAAGTALLPTTILMLLLSSWAGGLAQRIGPRWPMTAGTATCAVGLLLLTRIGAHARLRAGPVADRRPADRDRAGQRGRPPCRGGQRREQRGRPRRRAAGGCGAARAGRADLGGLPFGRGLRQQLPDRDGRVRRAARVRLGPVGADDRQQRAAGGARAAGSGAGVQDELRGRRPAAGAQPGSRQGSAR